MKEALLIHYKTHSSSVSCINLKILNVHDRFVRIKISFKPDLKLLSRLKVTMEFILKL